MWIAGQQSVWIARRHPTGWLWPGAIPVAAAVVPIAAPLVVSPVQAPPAPAGFTSSGVMPANITILFSPLLVGPSFPKPLEAIVLRAGVPPSDVVLPPLAGLISGSQAAPLPIDRSFLRWTLPPDLLLPPHAALTVLAQVSRESIAPWLRWLIPPESLPPGQSIVVRPEVPAPSPSGRLSEGVPIPEVPIAASLILGPEIRGGHLALPLLLSGVSPAPVIPAAPPFPGFILAPQSTLALLVPRTWLWSAPPVGMFTMLAGLIREAAPVGLIREAAVVGIDRVADTV